MSRKETFNCQSNLALIATPPQAYMCCGFCCDFPLFFTGTVSLVGPVFNTPQNVAYCEARYSYSPVDLVLWRINPCPEIAYLPLPYGPELRIAQGSNGAFYPICEGTDLSGDAFKTVWKINNALSYTGSCEKNDGNIIFNMSGTFLKDLCILSFDITGWGGFTDGTCAKTGTPPFWCVYDSVNDNYKCVCSWYLPPGAVSGPHLTISDCNSACGTSSPNPWWCVAGNCVQSDINPGSDKNAFETINDCQEICFTDQGAGWYCNNYYDPNLGITTGCQYFQQTPLNGSQKYSSYESCSEACLGPTTTTTTTTEGPTTTTTTTTATEAPAPGIYCYESECDYYADAPVGNSGGPYSDIYECLVNCESVVIPTTTTTSTTTSTTTTTLTPGTYYCVMSDEYTFVCVNAPTGAPPATVSGPYPYLEYCTAGCGGTTTTTATQAPATTGSPGGSTAGPESFRHVESSKDCSKNHVTFVWSDFLEQWVMIAHRSNCGINCQPAYPSKRGYEGEEITIPCANREPE